MRLLKDQILPSGCEFEWAIVHRDRILIKGKIESHLGLKRRADQVTHRSVSTHKHLLSFSPIDYVFFVASPVGVPFQSHAFVR